MIARSIFREEHEMWRESVRRFVEQEIVPHHPQWAEDGIVPRELWLKAGESGLLHRTVPEKYGGLGLDHLFHVMVFEELWRAGASGLASWAGQQGGARGRAGCGGGCLDQDIGGSTVRGGR